MDTRHFVPRAALAGLSLFVLTACGDSTGVVDPGSVSVNFRVASASGAPAVSGPMGVSGAQPVAGPPLVLTGTNGSLTIEEIRVIINEVELKPADGSCDTDTSGDDCPEFEAPPRFLDLALDGQPIEAVTVQIPAATYKELDFEIEDLEDDESDPAEAGGVATVRSQILAIVPDWPREASALVTGTFTPTGGVATDFRVFLKAEIEIEMALVPNLVVDDQGAVSRHLTIDISPDIWFKKADGTVKDLAQHDYDQTQDLLEFDVEMEDGFTKIEIE
jgi:hypothetical protein